MKLSAADHERILAATLRHYESQAEQFRSGKADHDVRQNINALLRHIVGAPPLTILDFGCGPGRDLKTFTQLGHRAIGLEGAEQFFAMARADTECGVWH